MRSWIQGPPIVLHERATITGTFARIVGVGVDSHGHIMVADGVAHHVDVYSSTGRFLRRVGRDGEGPGEFHAVTSISVFHDSLLVLDGVLQRITVFAPYPDTSSVARTIPAIAADGREAWRSLMVDDAGDMFLQYVGVAMRFGRPGDRDVLVRELSPSGRFLSDSIADVPDRDYMISQTGDGHVVEPMPFGQASIVALGPSNRLYFARTGATSITVRRIGAGIVGTIPIPIPTRSVTERDVDALIRSVESSGELLRTLTAKRWRRAWSKGRLPKTFPRMKSFVVDDSGWVWVNAVGPRDELVRRSWGNEYVSSGDTALAVVIQPARKSTHRVVLPDRGRVAMVRGGLLYAVSKDSLGVESVKVYAFR